jgi:hypothetical protein
MDKKTRKMMSLSEKVEMLGKRDRGMSIAMGRHHYGVNKNKQYLHFV